jgi:hypothetical protein
MAICFCVLVLAAAAAGSHAGQAAAAVGSSPMHTSLLEHTVKLDWLSLGCCRVSAALRLRLLLLSMEMAAIE